MQAMRAAFVGVIGMLAATAAYAQVPGSGPTTAQVGLGGRIFTVGPQLPTSQPTPLFSIGNLPVGIWAPVPPPYDATANRSAADNPLP